MFIVLLVVTFVISLAVCFMVVRNHKRFLSQRALYFK